MKDLPNTAPTNGLPEDLATMCLNAKQQPLNPHKQRLLSAAARVAKVDPGAGSKQKEPKAKGKAKAAAKKPKEPSQVKVTSKTDRDEYQKAYSGAKKKFMDGLLDWFGNLLNECYWPAKSLFKLFLCKLQTCSANFFHECDTVYVDPF